jgi:ParB family transcriptional regulator, chromosome partitioning protein
MTNLAEKAVAPAIDAADAHSTTGDTGSVFSVNKSGVSAAGTDKASAEKAAGEHTPADKPGLGPSGAEKATTDAAAHDKRRALGRGLESLLGPRVVAASAASATAPPAMTPAAAGSGAVPGAIAELHGHAAKRKPDEHEVLDLAISQIDVNPHQTRSFTKDEIESLHELRDSIKAQGVIQPITVRPGKDGRYFLITGERRMRAAKMAGKTTVPAIVRLVSDQQAAEMTVIENLQRRDLNCIDLARAYIMLSQDFALTQDQIGERVGVSRESVANYMRLSKLPEVVQIYLQNGALDFSHARILLNLKDPDIIAKVAHKAVDQEMSVDQLESFVLFDKSMFPGGKEPVPRGSRWVDPNVRAAQRELERILGVKVKIRDRKGKGKITLEYATLEDFDRVLGMLTGNK